MPLPSGPLAVPSADPGKGCQFGRVGNQNGAGCCAGLGEPQRRSVSLERAVSPRLSFRTEVLPPRIPGQAEAVRAASRERWGVPRAKLNAAILRPFASAPESKSISARRVAR
jgi:hypothetical protein